MIRTHIIVKGIVQGVGFRYFTYGLAGRLGLMGFVRNRPDGTVEIEVEGAESDIKAFVQDLRVGPMAAHVTGLVIDRLEPDGGRDGFEIRF